MISQNFRHVVRCIPQHESWLAERPCGPATGRGTCPCPRPFPLQWSSQAASQPQQPVSSAGEPLAAAL